jgi:hypothetical protein
MQDTPLEPPMFNNPAILLPGPVDQMMYGNFRAQLAAAPSEGLVVIELSTLGGDPDVARMMGEDVRFHSDNEPQRRFVFLGKAAIYSAGTVFMSFFARPNRYLTPGTRLMIHERLLSRTCRSKGRSPAASPPSRPSSTRSAHRSRSRTKGSRIWWPDRT